MPINGRRPSLCTAFSGWKLLGCVAILNWHLPLYKHSSQEAEVWVLVKVCWNIIFLLSEDRNRPGMGWWQMGSESLSPCCYLRGLALCRSSLGPQPFPTGSASLPACGWRSLFPCNLNSFYSLSLPVTSLSHFNDCLSCPLSSHLDFSCHFVSGF